MSIFGINFIILNSMQATKDLLEKRGKIYSARMSLPMFDIAEYNKLIAFETNTKRYVLSSSHSPLPSSHYPFDGIDLPEYVFAY